MPKSSGDSSGSLSPSSASASLNASRSRRGISKASTPSQRDDLIVELVAFAVESSRQLVGKFVDVDPTKSELGEIRRLVGQHVNRFKFVVSGLGDQSLDDVATHTLVTPRGHYADAREFADVRLPGVNPASTEADPRVGFLVDREHVVAGPKRLSVDSQRLDLVQQPRLITVFGIADVHAQSYAPKR